MTCHLCCDCCSCSAIEFNHMHQEVRSLFDCDLAHLFEEDDPFSMELRAEPIPAFDIDLFDKNMVKIAIWPYFMDDDEIIFDPETGRLTDETAQKVEHYLRLNMAMIPPDEEISPTLKD